MAINFPGPGIVELFYTVDGLQHKQTLSVRMEGTPTPGLDPLSYDLVQRDQIPINFPLWVSQWVTLLRPMYGALNMTFDRADLWWSDQTSFDKIFLTSESIALPGTGSNNENIANQMTMSFRTLEGGQMRVALMESSDGIPVNARQGYPTSDPETNALMAYVISTDSVLLGRDSSPPYSAIAVSSGQNEALWRKRYR